VILCLTVLGQTNVYGQSNEVDKILNNLEKKYNSTEAFLYEYKQDKSVSQLIETMHFTGKLVFRKPHFIRMEMRGDENLNIYVDGENIWLEDLDLEEVEKHDFAEMSAGGRFTRMFPVFLRSMDELKSQFKITLLKKEGGQNYLELIPKSDASSLASIKFSVDAWSRIRWMKVIYTNGDWTETRFHGWKKMPGISKHYFRYRESAKKQPHP